MFNRVALSLRGRMQQRIDGTKAMLDRLRDQDGPRAQDYRRTIDFYSDILWLIKKHESEHA